MNENIPHDFAAGLRRCLRPGNAPPGFTERLMAALPVERNATVVALRPRAAPPSARQFGVPAALAASLTLAVFLGVHVANDRSLREEQMGIAASEQLMQALRVTSRKLDLAYEAVNNPPTAGDEENRS
jgi:negative regulator of sigma E activity